MPGFFSARLPGGRRLSARPEDWRRIAARTAAILHTPLHQVLGWEWTECLLWWKEADDIHGETFGLMSRD
ncbi:hypothetical protein [Labrenzia sp. 011]|uniref:hypothetical protein n=1 Tax=Labrenzia sp. 011 TaxID=2171494 RepID=UPI000D51F729|nr:hypothetical protein [Labrenzia sp. 011]PVB59728.1 hypothetical protein DCO57_20640 [Labrenzia sp. 011]